MKYLKLFIQRTLRFVAIGIAAIVGILAMFIQYALTH